MSICHTHPPKFLNYKKIQKESYKIEQISPHDLRKLFTYLPTPIINA